MKIWRIFFSLGLVLTILPFIQAQDVEKTVNDLKSRIQNDPLKITGSFIAMGQYYQAIGLDNRALPFSGRLMAALNFDLLGLNMPLSLAFSNGGVVYNKRLPSYNFVGISPSYKWAKVLIGTRTMDFGKYSFSNHSFTGGGFELTPGNWNFSAFYGRLRRARIEDFVGLQRVDPFFRRMGYGVKAGYEEGKDKVMFSLFKAWDDGNSIPVPDSSFNFFPSENVIVSMEVSKAISKVINLEINYSNSGFTENRRLISKATDIRLSSYIGLLPRNLSTRTNHAFEAKVNFSLTRATLDLAYERIDPGYRTMGALFFNNDLENVSTGLKLKFFKSKWVINSRFGIQRNNLNGNQANDYGRFIGSIRTNIIASKKLSFTGGFSNFNNVNRRRSFLNPSNPILLTELVLNNQDASVGFNYMISNNNSRSSSLQGSLNHTRGNSIENDQVNIDQNTESTNAFLYYVLALKPSKWTFGANTGFQRNDFSMMTSNYSNIGISIAKKLLEEKLDLGLQTNFALNKQLVDMEEVAVGNLYTVMLSASWKTSKSTVLVFNSGFIHNDVENQSIGTKVFSEYRNTLNFQYRFNPKK